MLTTGIGKLMYDPILKNIGNTKLCELTLSVTEKRKIQGENKIIPSVLTFVIWDSGAEYIYENALKGDFLYVEATPRVDEWDKWDKDEILCARMSRIIFRIDSFRLFKQ